MKAKKRILAFLFSNSAAFWETLGSVDQEADSFKNTPFENLLRINGSLFIINQLIFLKAVQVVETLTHTNIVKKKWAGFFTKYETILSPAPYILKNALSISTHIVATSLRSNLE